LRLAVDQLAALKPDVLLVERSVARFAQGLLLQKGIALVLNVKRSLLDRLSRCTGARVRIPNFRRTILV
jgi:1-phosphatidylinositol-3-phosphate 5-kinase